MDVAFDKLLYVAGAGIRGGGFGTDQTSGWPALVVGLATYLIIRLSRKESLKRYERKPKNNWNALSEGVDPTDE